MARQANQKLKLMYLVKILLNNTDDTHSINMREILENLKSYGITAERKSIYSDINCLRQIGIDVIDRRDGKNNYYHIGNRLFELPELKLLIDSVQSSKFITSKKSNELIKKIESLASKYEASQLQRQVFIGERVKTMNESIYLNVDCIHSAIASNHKIRFQYFQWNAKKERELRKNGSFYEISPWMLVWDDENYYLIAFDGGAGIIKHYRVDKMLNIEETEDKREGEHCFEEFDAASYAKKIFGMFGGKECNVRIECENDFAGVMLDRFGTDIMLLKTDENHFAINVKVAVSMQFIHWVMALGNGVKITSPQAVVDEIKKEIKRLSEQYGIK